MGFSRQCSFSPSKHMLALGFSASVEGVVSQPPLRFQTSWVCRRHPARLLDRFPPHHSPPNRPSQLCRKTLQRPTMAIVWPSAGPLSAVTSWRAYVRASTGQTGAPAHLSSHLVQVMVRFQRQTSNLMASVVANQFARLAGTVFWLHYEHMHTELLSN